MVALKRAANCTKSLNQCGLSFVDTNIVRDLIDNQKIFSYLFVCRDVTGVKISLALVEQINHHHLVLANKIRPK